MKNNYLGILIIGCLLASCSKISNSGTISKTRGSINVTSNEHVVSISGEKSVEGKNIDLSIQIEKGYILNGCDYDSYSVSYENGIYHLTLENVLYPEMITLDVSEGKLVSYDFNGADYSSYVKTCDTSIHKRVNTELANNIYYDGYVLKGWNTKKDLSGEHIGIGSRVTVEDDISLYAEWEKQTPLSNFSYIEETDGILLTSYTGKKNVDKLVIPSHIKNKAVISLIGGFARNIIANEVILPSTIQKINNGAFKDSVINNLYMYENVTTYHDDSFRNTSVLSLHLNAYYAPRYQTSEMACFVDSIDRMILSDKKKMIFFAGCSFGYGLRSDLLSLEYPNYTVINCGVIGGTNTGLQWDIIAAFIDEGDVLIHAPEEASAYQLMDKNDAEPRMFLITEGNYDLLSYVDISKIDNFFSVLCSFNNEKLIKQEGGSYLDSSPNVNEYGDVIKDRPSKGIDESFSNGYTYTISYVNDSSMSLLNTYYHQMYFPLK